MGLYEERLDWAAGTERHAEAMYQATKNPYFVVLAIYAAQIAEWKAPEWAVGALLDAVKKAYSASLGGTALSIDKALGISTKRGDSPVQLKGERQSKERSIFLLIRTLTYCFDVSIPDACEAIYYSIDFGFAQSMQESLASDPLWVKKFDDERLSKIGMSRADLEKMIESERARESKIIEKRGRPQAVKSKLLARKWWEVTRGDSLGYSLDQLINRYYRVGSKQKFDYGKASEETYLHFKGLQMLRGPECAISIEPHENHDLKFNYVSALKEMCPTSKFKALVEWDRSRFG
jgi:hypothetical protein